MEDKVKGIFLKLFVNQFQKLDGVLVYEWLLEKAKSLGYPGGSAFLSLAGFGEHRLLHEEHFFELRGDLPVVVSFVLSEKQAAEFLNVIKEEKVEVFYVKFPVDYGNIK